MAFKHNAVRRHRIPKARYRVTNWAAYEAGLRRRGDLTFWLDETALAGWQAPHRTTPGGQPRYYDLAIELVLTQRLPCGAKHRQPCCPDPAGPPRPADRPAGPNGLAADHRLRQVQPRRDCRRPLQAPDRPKAPRPHPARSTGRGGSAVATLNRMIRTAKPVSVRRT